MVGTKISLSVNYDPGELLWTSAAELKVDGRVEGIKTKGSKFLNFNPSVEIRLLPPVTKYVSPNGGDFYAVLIERKPDKIKLSDTVMVPVPWSYLLLTVDNKENVSICWFFRSNPDQLFMPDEPLGASWLTKVSFDECGQDLVKYMEANKINVFNPSYGTGISDLISDAMDPHNLMRNINPNNYGLVQLAKQYGIDPNHFVEELQGKNIQQMLAVDTVCELSINTIHDHIVASAVENVPLLSESLIRGTLIES